MHTDKVVLVTGGNRGIGLELCKQFDSLGYKVIMGSRKIENGYKSVQKFRNNIIIKQLDVSSEASINELMKFTRDEFGRLDILINNAGLGVNVVNSLKINSAFHFVKGTLNRAGLKLGKTVSAIKKMANISTDVCEADLSGVKNILETNLFGAWKMIQVFLPLIKKSSEGRIINISSGLGQINGMTEDYAAYCISKLSLNALTIMFANKLKESGISVNSVCPGWVRTDMGGPDAPRGVEEGAETIIWLATQESITTGKFFKDKEIIDW